MTITSTQIKKVALTIWAFLQTVKLAPIARYFWNILVAIDQLANTLLLGDPDETISSRAAKVKARGGKWGCVLCKWLDAVDPGHCERVIERDEGSKAVLKDSQ